MVTSRPRPGAPARLGALVAAVVLVAVASSCTTASQVRWATYGPAAQQQIDAAAAAHDCGTLGELHARALRTSEAHRKASGITNNSLVAYIDTAMRSAGCPGA